MTVLTTDQEMLEKQNLDDEKIEKYNLVDEEVIKTNGLMNNISGIIDAKENVVIAKELEIETILSNTTNTTTDNITYLNLLKNLELPENTIKYRTIQMSGEFNLFYPIWFYIDNTFKQLIIKHGKNQSNDVFEIHGDQYNELFIKLYMKHNLDSVGIFEIACSHKRGMDIISHIDNFIKCNDINNNESLCPIDESNTLFFSGFYLRGGIEYTFGSEDEELLNTIEDRIQYINTLVNPWDKIYLYEDYYLYSIMDDELITDNKNFDNYLQGK
jgi:hypothetical protein